MTEIVLIAYGLLLIVGGVMGFRKGSKVSLIAGSLSGILVLAGVVLLGFNPSLGWISLSVLNALLAVSFVSRLVKTRKFMPSGMLLVISLGFLVFCLAHLGGNG